MVKNIFGISFGTRRMRSAPVEMVESTTPVVSVDSLPAFAAAMRYPESEFTIMDGNKFCGGFGPTQIQTIDYWTLRARSAQLFNDNLYARGIVRRLVTNEINTGLTPEAAPDEEILGVPEDSLDDWTEDVENRFGIWANSPLVCDWKQQKTFGALERQIRMEALVAGDVLVVLRMGAKTGVPAVQLIPGGRVQTPLTDAGKLRAGHAIKHGVEFDTVGRVAAYWVLQEDLSYKRLPAYGEKSGRKLAWLVFGTEKRLDEVRGMPLLAIVLQSLKEIDRYRDSVQRKAVINSILAMFIKKGQDKPGTLPFQNSAVRKDSVAITDPDTGKQRSFNIARQIPGVVFEELQTGEEPVGFDSRGTDLSFGPFEEAIIQAVAWANEIPPEILRLAFSNNYSASQAAINEFKIYLNMVWDEFGSSVCQPIYVEWLISEVLLRKVRAPGLLEAWRDPAAFETFGAWVACYWYGSIKPSTDMLKQAKGSQLLVQEGWSTNAREARITTGTKFSKNAKRLKRENQMKVDALRPIAEFEQEFGKPLQDVTGDIPTASLFVVEGGES